MSYEYISLSNRCSRLEAEKRKQLPDRFLYCISAHNVRTNPFFQVLAAYRIPSGKYGMRRIGRGNGNPIENQFVLSRKAPPAKTT